MHKGLYGTEKATWKRWEWVVSKSWDDLELGLEDWVSVPSVGVGDGRMEPVRWLIIPIIYLLHCDIPQMGPSCPLTTVPCFEYSKGSSKFSHLQVKFLPSLGGWVHKSVTRCVHHACPVGQTWPDDCFFINKVLLEHSYAQSFYVSLWQLLLWNGRPALLYWNSLLTPDLVYYDHILCLGPWGLDKTPQLKLQKTTVWLLLEVT